MATFFVDTTGSVVSASTGADSIYVQSGALQASTIYGLGGNDTINLAEAYNNASAAGFIADGGAGNDSIFVASGTFSAGQSTVLGGAGADTIAAQGGSLGLLKTGDDNDLVRGSAAITISALKLGKGADSVVFGPSTLSGVTVKEFGTGQGHDFISGSFINFLTAGTITLGGGKDTINASLSGASGAIVYGDGSGLNPNADLIDLEINRSTTAIRVKGQDGADSILISGLAVSSFVAGGAGDDSISVTAIYANSTLAGGSGNDSIYVTSGIGDEFTGVVIGGAGNDSIELASTVTGSKSALDIQGGAGADTVTFTGVTTVTGEYLGTWVASSLSESNLSAMDVVNVNSTISGTSLAAFNFGNSASFGSLTGASAQVLFGNTTAYAAMNSGVVTLNGELNVSSVTAAAASVDTLTLDSTVGGAGTFAYFTTNGGATYLFMQGGSAGTADDSIVNISGGTLKSTLALQVLNSAAVLTFSGQ